MDNHIEERAVLPALVGSMGVGFLDYRAELLRKQDRTPVRLVTCALIAEGLMDKKRLDLYLDYQGSREGYTKLDINILTGGEERARDFANHLVNVRDEIGGVLFHKWNDCQKDLNFLTYDFVGEGLVVQPVYRRINDNFKLGRMVPIEMRFPEIFDIN